MHVCPHCQSPLSFGAVLVAMNPARIPCGQCKQKIKVSLPAVSVICVFLLAATLGLLWWLYEQGMDIQSMAIGILLLGIVAEVGYFLGLRSGLIKSDMVPGSPSADSE